MLIDNLRRLMQTMTFAQLRELACEYIRFRGYGDPVITDGWSDGGSDLRVHQTSGRAPLRIAIQTTVQEKGWKAKLKEDARTALAKLDCGVFLYVTNRRLGDADYQPVEDELLQQDGISCSKADGDSLAHYVLRNDKVDWLLALMGINFAGRIQQRSIRQEVTDACILFSNEAEDYRRTFLERALMVASNNHDNGTREQIIQAAQEALGLDLDTFTGRLSSRFDSLLTRGIVQREEGAFALSDEESKKISQAYSIRDTQWVQLQNAIQAILREHCPSAVSNASISTSVTEVASRLGQLVRAYRDYQLNILENRVADDELRKKCVRAASHIEAMLTTAGVPQADIGVCQANLSSLQKSNPIVALLEAGETFRQLVAGSKETLFNALGQTTGAAVVLDASIIIPLLCGKLHGGIKDRAVAGAMHLLDGANGHACPVYAPSVYVEEAASHLIMAGRFEPVVLSVERSELSDSNNAFVSYFANSTIDAKKFRDFIGSFGFKEQGIDFYLHRNAIGNAIGGLLRRYGVNRMDIQQRYIDRDAIKDAETALGHIYHRLNVDRPGVLFRHDCHVLASMKMQERRENEAQIFVTWDRCMQSACEGIHDLVFGLDPVNAAELFELAADMGEHTPDIELIKQLDDEDMSLASNLWDVIIEVAKDDLSDARLLEMAGDFRHDFLTRHQSEAVRIPQIAAAWNEWKAAAGASKG